MRYKDISKDSQEVPKLKAMSLKTNWRITRLPNGLLNGEYTADAGVTWTPVIEGETVYNVEVKIDNAIKYAVYEAKYATDTPVVVKTFTNPGKK